MADTIKLSLQQSEAAPSTKRRLFSCFVEMAQNIIHYSSETLTPRRRSKPKCDRDRSASAMPTIATTCCARIASPPPTSRRCAPSSNRCATMTLEEIKRAYQDTLRADQPEGSKGLGPGFPHRRARRERTARIRVRRGRKARRRDVLPESDRLTTSESAHERTTMENLHIAATADSPEVDFRFDAHALASRASRTPRTPPRSTATSSGACRSISRAAATGTTVTVDVSLIYFNSSSTKMLFALFDALQRGGETRRARRAQLASRCGRRHDRGVRRRAARRFPRARIPRPADRELMAVNDLFEAEEAALARR